MNNINNNTNLLYGQYSNTIPFNSRSNILADQYIDFMNNNNHNNYSTLNVKRQI